MSNFLLAINASVVAITYGVMDVIYRAEFVAAIKKHFRYILCFRTTVVLFYGGCTMVLLEVTDLDRKMRRVY